ncbi:glycoside hydrolase family 3 N-terminal domain-containing protein [Nakamurella endophytica]|uniref:Beta-glucosidase n=1 Tax=Nakamurella endophytica TaxID=1748367 RepID=A0A917WBQ9_9ACTN|nr:glycoside hydrolase family 3 N-terminal domain-containing protein [Nakamurella endophytica]GGL87712.1 beta-glucosidase [Nakamurella endophytica]
MHRRGRAARATGLVLLTVLLAGCSSAPSPADSSPGPGAATVGTVPSGTPSATPPMSGSPGTASRAEPGRATSTPRTGTTARSPGSPARTAPSGPTSTPRTVTVSRLPTTGPTASPSRATTSPARPKDCVDRVLAGLDGSRLVGQLVMIGLPVEDPVSAAEALSGTPVGGVFLAGRSTRPATALARDVATLQQRVGRRSGVPLHVAVDQEGGYVQSLTGDDFPPIPTAVEQGELSGDDLAALTRRWAGRLHTAGVTLDLAPVADTVPPGTADDNPPIGANDRQYGSDPDQVAGAVTVVVRGLQAEGVGATVKHFPGLGRVRVNTDTDTGAVDDEVTPDDPYLAPFRAGIAAGAVAVMVSSARYPQLDPDEVAAFSRPVVTGLLRDRLHFSGLVVSDDLGNAVAVQDRSAGRRAVDFVRAGGDLVLSVRTQDLAPMTAALTAEAARDAGFRARVRDAARHVLASKRAVGLLDCAG